jgi:hypothetical protein
MNDDHENEAEYPIADAIDAAEEIRDPLDGLIEKSAIDAGSLFAPEVVARLAALKKEDRAAFETLRSELKKAGCRVTALDEAIAEESGEAGGRGPSQADILIELAQSTDLFHSPDGTGFADLDINGHRETWPIRSSGFKDWLTRRYYEETGGAPSRSEPHGGPLKIIRPISRRSVLSRKPQPICAILARGQSIIRHWTRIVLGRLLFHLSEAVCCGR